MSLGGLALATGLVVDDSIVVLESIAKARERGLGILQAAIAGTREVSMAVVASTLTTIAVFLPLVFVEGIAGQLFRDQALTVARSEEHTSELQSLMRLSYAVFCLTKTKSNNDVEHRTTQSYRSQN